MKVSSYTFETFCKNIDFGGFDTYKRERISGLQNVKMPTFLFSSNRELSGYRLRSRRRSPPRRAVCSGNAPSEKMSPQSERAPTKTDSRNVPSPCQEKQRREGRKANSKKKKKKMLIIRSLKKKSQIISARVQSAGMASKFNGSIMCRRVTECEAEAACECAASSGESKSGIGWWIVKRSVSGGSYSEKSEGLAGVFLRNVDKEFPQQAKQNSWQGFLRRVDMIINVRQRGT